MGDTSLAEREMWEAFQLLVIILGIVMLALVILGIVGERHDRAREKEVFQSMSNKKETYSDLVRRIGKQHRYNNLTEDDIDFILWERTPFPMLTSAELLTPYIETYFTNTPITKEGDDGAVQQETQASQAPEEEDAEEG